jgi:hypothetical protein
MTQTETYVELTREDIVREVEEVAHRMGMSANKFARAYKARNLCDTGSLITTLVLLDLLPDEDPLFDGAFARVGAR